MPKYYIGAKGDKSPANCVKIESALSKEILTGKAYSLIKSVIKNITLFNKENDKDLLSIYQLPVAAINQIDHLIENCSIITQEKFEDYKFKILQKIFFLKNSTKEGEESFSLTGMGGKKFFFQDNMERHLLTKDETFQRSYLRVIENFSNSFDKIYLFLRNPEALKKDEDFLKLQKSINDDRRPLKNEEGKFLTDEQKEALTLKIIKKSAPDAFALSCAKLMKNTVNKYALEQPKIVEKMKIMQRHSGIQTLEFAGGSVEISIPSAPSSVIQKVTGVLPLAKKRGRSWGDESGGESCGEESGGESWRKKLGEGVARGRIGQSERW